MQKLLTKPSCCINLAKRLASFDSFHRVGRSYEKGCYRSRDRGDGLCRSGGGPGQAAGRHRFDLRYRGEQRALHQRSGSRGQGTRLGGLRDRCSRQRRSGECGHSELCAARRGRNRRYGVSVLVDRCGLSCGREREYSRRDLGWRARQHRSGDQRLGWPDGRSGQRPDVEDDGGQRLDPGADLSHRRGLP